MTIWIVFWLVIRMGGVLADLFLVQSRLRRVAWSRPFFDAATVVGTKSERDETGPVAIDRASASKAWGLGSLGEFGTVVGVLLRLMTVRFRTWPEPSYSVVPSWYSNTSLACRLSDGCPGGTQW